MDIQPKKLMSTFKKVGNFALNNLSLTKTFNENSIIVIKPTSLNVSNLITETHKVSFKQAALLSNKINVNSSLNLYLIKKDKTYTSVKITAQSSLFLNPKGLVRSLIESIIPAFDTFANSCLLAEPKDAANNLLSPKKTVNYYEKDEIECKVPDELIQVIEKVSEKIYGTENVLNIDSDIIFTKRVELFYSTDGSEIVQYFYDLSAYINISYINDKQNLININLIEKIDLDNIPVDLEKTLIDGFEKAILDNSSYTNLTSGEYNVVLDPSASNVFFHEAMGAHMLSGTYIAEQISTVFRDRLNHYIPSLKGIDMIMDPTFKGGVGSYMYDHEGVKSQKVTLLKDGVITDYLHDRKSKAQLEIEFKDLELIKSLLLIPDIESLLPDFVPKERLARKFKNIEDQLFYLLRESLLNDLIASLNIDKSLNWREDFSRLEGISNGHCRVESWISFDPNSGETYNTPKEARMSNIIVRNNNPEEVSIEKAIENLCKNSNDDFYLKVSAFDGEVNVESGLFTIYPSLIKKVYLDGSPEENVDLGSFSMSLESFFDYIELIGKDYELNHGACGADSGYVPVSSSTPSMVIRKMPYQSAEKLKPVDDLVIDILANKFK